MALPLPLCRTSTGVYRIYFDAHGGLYKKDSASAFITATSANKYCTVGAVECGDDFCGGGRDVYVDAYCYDRFGNLSDTVFNFSVVYH